MSAKMESKQPMPSVMARLMGFDELLPQQSSQKRARVLSENYLQKVACIGVRGKYSERHSFRLDAEEQKAYRDFFQALETVESHKHHTMPVEKRKTHSSSSEEKMTSMKREFAAEKHMSVDKKLQSLDEFHGVPKKNGLIKHIIEPGLPDIPNHSPLGKITVLTTSSVFDRQDIRKCRKSRDSSQQGYMNSLRRVENCRGTNSSWKRGLHDMNEFQRKEFNSSGLSCLPTARIVVLKPNLRKEDYAVKGFSSSTIPRGFSWSGDQKHEEVRDCQHGDFHVEVRKRKSLTNGMIPVWWRSRSSKEITRRMGHDSHNFAGDSKMMENQIYHSDVPHLAGETKKQTFERWKTTEKFQQVELVSKNKALGETLVLPDDELRILNYKPDKCGLRSEVSPDGTDRNFCVPSQTRYRDRHNSLQQGASNIVHEPIDMEKHLTMKRGSNQKHVSESCNNHKMPQSIPYLDFKQDQSAEHNCVIQKEMENKINEIDSFGQNSTSFMSSEWNRETLQNPQLSSHEPKNENWDGKFPEKDLSMHKSSVSSVSSINEVADVVPNAETKLVKWLPSYLDVQDLESTKCILPFKDEDSSLPFSDTLVWQEISNGISKGYVPLYCSYTNPDQESLDLEDEDRTSPNSVLTPLHQKDISSRSDYFESSDVLNDLNLELETLKSETSEAYSEGSGMVSSDEDIEEESVSVSEANDISMRSFKVEESRDFSYLVDVLHEAGIHRSNLDSGFDMLASYECPVNSSVFENLEKKYGEQSSWNRSERKLLFDRINSALMDILLPSVGVLIWTKPVAKRFNFGMGQEVIEEELWTFLVSQEKDASKESEKFLGKDERWFELTDDIQTVSIEIENSLVDELVEDVIVGMDSF